MKTLHQRIFYALYRWCSIIFFRSDTPTPSPCQCIDCLHLSSSQMMTLAFPQREATLYYTTHRILAFKIGNQYSMRYLYPRQVQVASVDYLVSKNTIHANAEDLMPLDAIPLFMRKSFDKVTISNMDRVVHLSQFLVLHNTARIVQRLDREACDLPCACELLSSIDLNDHLKLACFLPMCLRCHFWFFSVTLIPLWILVYLLTRMSVNW